MPRGRHFEKTRRITYGAGMWNRRPHQHKINYGKTFERILEHQAAVLGLLMVHHGTRIKILQGGAIQPVKSDLDYTLANKHGVVAFVDAKTFDAEAFTYSMLDPWQLSLAYRFASFNITSGFIVWLRKVDRVVFYTGTQIHAAGPRSRFGVKDGLELGPSNHFALGLVLR